MLKLLKVFKVSVRFMATNKTDLKAVLRSKIEVEQDKIKKFRKKFGNRKVGEVTVNMMYGGMRGIKGLVCETSLLDPEEGIRFRGFTIPDLQKHLPKVPQGSQPLPEGIFWLLLTGELPTEAQVKWVSKQLVERSTIPGFVVDLLDRLPITLHPMAQLSCLVTALHNDSKFNQAYNIGLSKLDYWEFVFEDALDLIAKITGLAALIFKKTYKNKFTISPVDPNKDWAYNYTKMLGFDSHDMVELIRLYLTLHCDHEGGNVSAHTTHLVGSALSDCYLSYAAGINGLAGPLHGLANQDALMWLQNLKDTLGTNIADDKLQDYIQEQIKSGKVIPGYGHAVLRRTDPRFLCLREFALKHFPDDPLFKLCSQTFRLVPPLLYQTGKVQNPWPNVDAHSGVLLQYYGLKEMQFYTVMFAVSRALGVLASLIWDRALGLPIERPKSMTTDALIKTFGVKL